MRLAQGCGTARWTLRTISGTALLSASLACFVALLPARRVRAASTADRTAGAELFKEKGCAHCHGADGVGTDRAPALDTVGKRLKKDEIRRQIVEGGKQMPAFGDSLSKDEVRDLVDYLAHSKKAAGPEAGS
jgi:ubiquinol-cytochrome c reductase cytochrome b subunit